MVGAQGYRSTRVALDDGDGDDRLGQYYAVSGAADGRGRIDDSIDEAAPERLSESAEV